jgi:hypothetical protein
MSVSGSASGAEHTAGRGVDAPSSALGLGVRFFAAPRGQPRARRGTDVVILVAAAIGVGLAIAAVLLYRIATFYLPPAWGFPAMLWLQRNRYL